MIQLSEYCSPPSLGARQHKRGDGNAWHMSGPRFSSGCHSALTDPWIYPQSTFLVIYCNKTTHVSFCLYFNLQWGKECNKISTSSKWIQSSVPEKYESISNCMNTGQSLEIDHVMNTFTRRRNANQILHYDFCDSPSGLESRLRWLGIHTEVLICYLESERAICLLALIV